MSSTATTSFITYSEDCYFNDVYIDWNTTSHNIYAVYCDTSEKFVNFNNVWIDVANEVGCYAIYCNKGKVRSNNLVITGGGSDSNGIYIKYTGTEESNFTNLILNGTFAATSGPTSGAFVFFNVNIKTAG